VDRFVLLATTGKNAKNIIIKAAGRRATISPIVNSQTINH
jgi:hypothetical protein